MLKEKENKTHKQIRNKLINKMATMNDVLMNEVKERQSSEVYLKHNTEKYRSIISCMELGLVELDNDDVITHVNDRFLQMMGYPPNVLIGLKYMDAFCDNSSREIMIRQNEKRKTGAIGTYEVKLKNKDGESIWILINGAPLFDRNYNVVGSIGAHLDITQRKKMEQDLIDAKENAEDVARIRTQFLANMSHEVRTPMNGIIGLTKLLLNTELNEKQREYLNAIDISSNTLLVLVNDILDISKIEAGKMNFESKDFKLKDLVSSVVDVFESKAAEKKLDLESYIDRDIPEVIVGDMIRLNQVLYNLINNAIKFTEKGKVIVQVDLVDQSETGVLISFSVIDSGIGISEENQEKIFDDFIQAKGDTTRIYGGTGLGLSIVKKIAELQGGEISLKSKEGEGSVFTVKLKFQVSAIESAELADNCKDCDGMSDFKNMRILLAEDNSINQLLTNDLLSEKGAIVNIVPDGKKAVEAVKANDYDIVLMDMQMPVMDGYEAMQLIRQIDGEKRDIAIIALTAHAILGEREKCKDAGADDYLSKPFQAAELLSMICSLYRKKKRTIETTELDNDFVSEFNIKKLQEFTNNRHGIIVSTLEVLIETLKQDSGMLENALRNNDDKKVKTVAHKMKPNFDLIGLEKLRSASEQIQTCEEIDESIRTMVENIVESTPAILGEIDDKLKELINNKPNE